MDTLSSPLTRMRTPALIILFLFFFPFVVAVSPAGCGRRSTQAKTKDASDASLQVKTEAVRREEVRRAIEIVGTLGAFEEVIVSAQVEGAVSKILADLGDRVRKGQALIELDREKLQYRLDERRAALQRALARYGVRNVGEPLPAIESTPEVEKAAAELVQAEQTWKRAAELHRRSLIPKQQQDDAEAKYRTAEAVHRAALQNAKNARAEIAAAEAEMHLATREWSDAIIRAPFDAYVQKRLVAPGQFVKAQNPVMSLVIINPLKLSAEVPERMIPWVRLGQAVTIQVESYPARSFSGVISRLSPAVNQQTRAFPLEARVPNEAGLLRPGTFARVQLTSDKVDVVLTLPVTALQYRYGVNRVYVLQGNRVISREVKLGDRLSDRTEVVSGVDAGEVVVASDVEKLTDGTRVTSSGGP